MIRTPKYGTPNIRKLPFSAEGLGFGELGSLGSFGSLGIISALGVRVLGAWGFGDFAGLGITSWRSSGWLLGL